MRQSGLIISTLFFAVIISFAITPAAFAICDQGDAPDCICFDDTGDWDAGGPSPTQPIQSVALDTLGMQESCATNIDGDELEKDTGKPYYSIVLGYNTEAGALWAADLMSQGLGSFEHRQAWCSEAISYWHREAGIPYFYGYRNTDWHPQWLVKSVLDLKTWYETEEGGGRGRWIDAGEIDYQDFQPGVNAPVPGAYMAWTGCAKNILTDTWDYYAFAVSHSLMVDEMWIHRDGSGRVFRVEVSFIEGNSSNRVRNTRKWDDLIAFTPQGSQWIGWNDGADGISNTIDDIGLKIYGFGVDLDAAGQPIYDESRLHFVDYKYMRLVSIDPVITEDDEWDNNYASRVPLLKTLASKLRDNNGPKITCSSNEVKCDGMPDGGGNAWSFPKGIKEEVVILVDFLSPNALPLEGVRMFWDPDFLPQNFEVQMGDAKQNFFKTQLTEISQYKPCSESPPVPLMASLDTPKTDIRYVKFIFPKGTFDTNEALMMDLLLPYDEGKYPDTDEVPEDMPVFVDIMPGDCPNEVTPSDSGRITIALLGSDTIAAGGIVVDSLRFNGNTIKPLTTSYEDVATPFIGSAPGCHTLGMDGYTDLLLEYDLNEFVTELGLKSMMPGANAVRVSGQMNQNYDNAPLLGQDFVVILAGDTDIYYPHVASNAKWETEICVINKGNVELSGTMSLYDSKGALLSDKGITLGSHARNELLVGKEFLDAEAIRYIIFTSDSPNVCGYTKFYHEGLYRVAVPAVQSINAGDIYVPHIDSSTKWWTGIALVNTTDAKKTLDINFNTGETKQIALAAGEHTQFNIKDLFEGVSQPNLESAEISPGAGIIGLELFSAGNTLSGVLLKDDAAGTLYFPHVVNNDKWWTGIAAYNPSPSTASLTVSPYTELGTALAPLNVDIDPGGKYLGDADDLKLPEGTAWFKINSSQDLNGFELFGHRNGNLLAGYSVININSKEGVFPKLEQDGWTGIAFVNTADANAKVTLTMYDDDGFQVAEENMTLAAYEKVLGNPEDIFSGSITAGRYLTFSSDKDVVGFQLNASEDGMMLDGLPGM
jgi:hypothetical protein